MNALGDLQLRVNYALEAMAARQREEEPQEAVRVEVIHETLHVQPEVTWWSWLKKLWQRFIAALQFFRSPRPGKSSS